MLLTRSVLEGLRGSNPLVIMHWDADAISTAAMLIKYLDVEPVLYTPPIGIYRVIPEDLPLDGVSSIVDVDLGVSTKVLEGLRDSTGLDVYVIDHHRREESDKIFIADYLANNIEFPSASTTFLSIYNMEPDLLSMIGLAGDLSHRLDKSVFKFLVDGVALEYGLGWRDILEIAALLDTNYLAMDREGVYKSVYTLLDKMDDPKSLLELDEWRMRLEAMEAEVEKAVASAEKLDGVVYAEVKSRFLITSKVGRMLSKQYPDKYVFVVSRGYLDGYGQLYVRCEDCDLTPLINRLVEKGFDAGGRRNVLGVIVEMDRFDDAYQVVKEYLGVEDEL